MLTSQKQRTSPVQRQNIIIIQLSQKPLARRGLYLQFVSPRTRQVVSLASVLYTAASLHFSWLDLTPETDSWKSLSRKFSMAVFLPASLSLQLGQPPCCTSSLPWQPSQIEWPLTHIMIRLGGSIISMQMGHSKLSLSLSAVPSSPPTDAALKSTTWPILDS